MFALTLRFSMCRRVAETLFAQDYIWNAKNMIINQFIRFMLFILCGIFLTGTTLANSTYCRNECEPERQFYLGGIIGSSWITLTEPASQPAIVGSEPVFTAGGTAGMAIRRNSWFSELPGQLRLEFEARGRDQIVTSESVSGDTATERATNGWSTMVNVWRDNKFSEKWGYYLGAGIGAGGFRSTFDSNTGLISNNENVSSFAWQAGTGLIWEISDRTTLDIGYRFFSINTTQATLDFIGTPLPYERSYSASELLLSIRVYEPFRRFMK